MPQKFESCISKGGKVRRISGPDKRWKVPKGHWRNICFLPNGKTYPGELHTLKPKIK